MQEIKPAEVPCWWLTSFDEWVEQMSQPETAESYQASAIAAEQSMNANGNKG